LEAAAIGRKNHIMNAQLTARKIAAVLANNPRRTFTPADMYMELLRTGEMEISQRDVYRALDLLPAGCVTRVARRVSLQARTFAPPAEVRAALERLAAGFNYLTLTREHRAALIAELHLSGERALNQSLTWAAPRARLEVDLSSFYGGLVKILPVA
jgi:hypothetical protein